MIISFDEYLGIDYEGINSKKFEDIIAEYLESKGAKVERQVWVNNRGDGRRGRVDIVGYLNCKSVGIEIDRIKVRKKSIHKLHELNCDEKIVICRSPFSVTVI